ncbi:UNVERIFIED_CONTAM: hypothetical protein Slati_4461100 [Sesamum latifolium]|uniref:CCHC-type domain-containing protein n=1 Tax=Sesamum latifolium TaxID=2727402 RepID=A0AAW2SR88_9LAMI
MGEEHMVKFTYERPPNFCYFCGRLGHISKYCELQFADDFQNPGPDTPFGPWLQVPLPTRGPAYYLSSGRSRGLGSNQQQPRRASQCGPAIFRDFTPSQGSEPGEVNRNQPQGNRMPGSKGMANVIPEPEVSSTQNRQDKCACTADGGKGKALHTVDIQAPIDDEERELLQTKSLQLAKATQTTGDGVYLNKLSLHNIEEGSLHTVPLRFAARGLGCKRQPRNGQRALLRSSEEGRKRLRGAKLIEPGLE